MMVAPGPTVRSPTPLAVPIYNVPVRSSTLPVSDTVSTPELVPCEPTVRSVPVTVAPFRIDRVADPASASVASPVSASLVPAPDRLMMPCAVTPASSPAAETVAPWEIDSEPKPALPTSKVPPTCQSAPAPVTLTADPPAAAVLAMTAGPVSVRLAPWPITRKAALPPPTVTVPSDTRVAPAANCHSPPPPNDTAAAVPVPAIAPPPLVNATASPGPGTASRFQLAGSDQTPPLALIQVNVAMVGPRRQVAHGGTQDGRGSLRSRHRSAHRIDAAFRCRSVPPVDQDVNTALTIAQYVSRQICRPQSQPPIQSYLALMPERAGRITV